MQHDLCNLGSQIQIRILQKERTLCYFFAFFYSRKQRTNRQFHETRASLNFLNISWDQDVRITRTFDWTMVFDHVLSKFYLKGDRGKLFSAGLTCIRQTSSVGANLRDGGGQHSNWTEQHTVVLLFVLPNNNIFRIIMYPNYNLGAISSSAHWERILATSVFFHSRSLFSNMCRWSLSDC